MPNLGSRSIGASARRLRQRLAMIVGAGETAEIATVADAVTGHEERGAGRLRARRLGHERAGEHETRGRDDPCSNTHRTLQFAFGVLMKRSLTSTRRAEHYSGSADGENDR